MALALVLLGRRSLRGSDGRPLPLGPMNPRSPLFVVQVVVAVGFGMRCVVSRLVPVHGQTNGLLLFSWPSLLRGRRGCVLFSFRVCLRPALSALVRVQSCGLSYLLLPSFSVVKEVSKNSYSRMALNHLRLQPRAHSGSNVSTS